MFSNLILFDKSSFQILGLIESFNRELKENEFNSTTNFICNKELYEYCIELSQKRYSLKFDSNPLTEKITIKNIIYQRVEPYISPEERKEKALAKGIISNMVQDETLKKSTETLSKAVFSNMLSNEKLGHQIKALSTALFEMSLKK